MITCCAKILKETCKWIQYSINVKWWHIKISGNHIGKIKQESGHHYPANRIPERRLVCGFFADYTLI